MAEPVDPTIPIPCKLFDDVNRILIDGTITPAEVVTIAERASLHPGKATPGPNTFALYRIGLGPGKWVYVAAPDIQKLRDAVPPKA